MRPAFSKTGAVVLVLGIVLLGSIWAVATFYKPGPSWEERSVEMKQLGLRMQELVTQMTGPRGQSRCKADSDCRVVGVGAKTCGGYGDFLIYSIRDADEPRLMRLVTDFNRASERYNVLSMRVPACGTKAGPIHCDVRSQTCEAAP